MSIGTLLGFFAGIGLFVGAIFMSTDNYGVFVSLSSFIIVVGGALAASFVSYEIRYVMLALKMTYKIHGAPTIGDSVQPLFSISPWESKPWRLRTHLC